MADVLVVDDDDALLDLFEHMLALFGHRVVYGASSGRQALEWLKAAASLPDLIILDQRMPEMTGLELLQVMPARAAKVPVILVTGDEAAHSKVTAMRGVALLVKPFTMNQLIRHVEATVGGAPPEAGAEVEARA